MNTYGIERESITQNTITSSHRNNRAIEIFPSFFTKLANEWKILLKKLRFIHGFCGCAYAYAQMYADILKSIALNPRIVP